MSYTNSNWTCLSPSLNQGQETIIPFGGSPIIVNAPNFFIYGSPNDTVTEIITSGYFNPIVTELSVGDWIIGNGSDGSFVIFVQTIINGVVTVSFVFDTTGPYLLKAANLSDLPNVQTAFANMGLGSGQVLILTDSDFSGGIYQLTNPCPNYITLLCNTPGNELRLPIATGPDSFSLSEGPYVQVPFGFQNVDVSKNSGASIITLEGPSMVNFTLSSKSTSDGTWQTIFRVLDINSLSGSVDIISSDSSVTIDTSTREIDLTVSPGANGTLQDAYDNGNGTITIDNSVNTKPFAVGRNETNPFNPYGVYVSAVRNLQATPTLPWFQFFEANDSLSTMVQYGGFACQIKDNTSGSVSAFMSIGAAVGSASGEVLPFFIADGLDEQSVSTHPLLISLSPAVIDPSSMLDIVSTTEGSRPFPLMTDVQYSAISSRATGLSAYTTDNNLIKYYDGIAEQTLLTVDNVLAGSNITVTQNGDGTITLDSSGGTPGTQGSYASFSVNASAVSTVMTSAGTIYPISVPIAFNDLSSSDFVNELKSISGIVTPTTRYIGTSTQFFTVNTTVYARGAVASQIPFSFYLLIYKADTSIVNTLVLGRVVLQDLIFPYGVTLNGIVQLSTGDAVFIGVASSTPSTSVIANYMSLDICTVDSSQEVAMVWTTVGSTSASMVSQNGYITNNAGVVTLTLPSVANVGSEIRICGKGSGGWSIAQPAGVSINVGSSTSTVGVTGSVSSTNKFDSLILTCVTQNTAWNAYGIQGNLTVV